MQTFFCLRCYRVLPKHWNLIGAFCFAIAFVRFIGSLILGVQAAQAMDLAIYRRDWGWLITSLLVVGAFIDITIAVSLMSYLIRKRDKVFARLVTLVDTGSLAHKHKFNRAAQMIDKIVQYTICALFFGLAIASSY